MSGHTATPVYLPCPFCGDGRPQAVCGGPGNWYIRCIGCGAATDDVMRDRAVILWNTRVSAEPTAMNAALQFYAESYCEGWCKDSPLSASFDDCGGCKARLALNTSTPSPDAESAASNSHAELVKALELARARIEYLGAACSNPKHFEANANHFLPAIDEALATLTARKVG